MDLSPGTVIEGKYRIVRILGQGGMGAVYEGVNTLISRRVAIKVLHASLATKDTPVERFKREAHAAGRIGSEHIVEVLDIGSLPSGELFMVMEFLEGEDLGSRIKKLKRLTTPPSSSTRSSKASPPPTRPASSTATSSPRTSTSSRPAQGAAISSRSSTSASRSSPATTPSR